MKTPWRFFSELVSRKSPEDPKSAQDTKAPDVAAIEYHPAADEKITDAAVDRSIDPAVVPDAQAADLTTEPDASDAAFDIVKDDDLPAAAPLVRDAAKDEPVSTAAKATKTRQAKTSRQTATVQSPVSVPEERPQPQPVVEKTISGEITELDQEISELRRLLAQKLARQNAQLKKMLERYEP